MSVLTHIQLYIFLVQHNGHVTKITKKTSQQYALDYNNGGSWVTSKSSIIISNIWTFSVTLPIPHSFDMNILATTKFTSTNQYLIDNPYSLPIPTEGSHDVQLPQISQGWCWMVLEAQIATWKVDHHLQYLNLEDTNILQLVEFSLSLNARVVSWYGQPPPHVWWGATCLSKNVPTSHACFGHDRV